VDVGPRASPRVPIALLSTSVSIGDVMAKSNDFSHLETEEKVFIARNRVLMLSNALVDVIKLNEQKHAFHKSQLYRDRHELEAVKLLFETLENYEVAQICRLWDQLDPAGFSLPTIANLLEGPDVRQQLSGRGVITSLRPIDPDFLIIFDEAISEAAAIAKSAAHERLQNYRHKVIAHPIYKTRQERKNKIEPPLASDIDFLVLKAWQIMEVFQNVLSLKLAKVDYQHFKIQFGEEVKTFYENLACSLPIP
jgi:hypothetical protein